MDVLPTLQFWSDGAKLWEHRGIIVLDQDLAEGARRARALRPRARACSGALRWPPHLHLFLGAWARLADNVQAHL